MKKEILEQEIRDVESKIGKAECSYSTEKMANQQVMLNKLFIRVINEANENMAIYNRRLLGYTIVIAALTLIMLVKMFIK